MSKDSKKTAKDSKRHQKTPKDTKRQLFYVSHIFGICTTQVTTKCKVKVEKRKNYFYHLDITLGEIVFFKDWVGHNT